MFGRAPSEGRDLHLPRLEQHRSDDTHNHGTQGRPGQDAQAREAQTLGFKKLILPESNKKGLEKRLAIRVVGVKKLEHAMDELF